MTINLKYAGQSFRIKCERYQYVPVKVGINQTETSKNFGKETERDLGYHSSLGNAIEDIIKEGNGDSSETLTLREYVQQVEQMKEDMVKTFKATV